MRLIKKDEIKEALDEAIKDRLCVQAWLGHGNDLFLGFGDSLPDPAEYDFDTYRPKYQLKTTFADWRIETSGRLIVESNEDPYEAESAAQCLVGRHAINWKFIDSTLELEICFEGDTVLKITRMSSGNEHDNELLHEELGV